MSSYRVRSPFIRQHDGQHAAVFAEVGWVVGTHVVVQVIGVHFPKQLMPAELECAEVMLSMWVIVFVEVIELGNLLDQHLSGDIQLLQQVHHPGGYKPLPWYAGISPAESIVELGYLGGSG